MEESLLFDSEDKLDDYNGEDLFHFFPSTATSSFSLFVQSLLSYLLPRGYSKQFSRVYNCSVVEWLL